MRGNFMQGSSVLAGTSTLSVFGARTTSSSGCCLRASTSLLHPDAIRIIRRAISTRSIRSHTFIFISVHVVNQFVNGSHCLNRDAARLLHLRRNFGSVVRDYLITLPELLVEV